MILSALNDYYQRLLEQGADGVSPFGYSQEKISYEILLSPDGEVVDVNDIRQVAGNKPIPRSLSVPQPEKRTSGTKSNFLWDKTSYVLGVSSKDGGRTALEHAAFKELHLQALADEDDAGLQSLTKFLKQWEPQKFRPPTFSEEMLTPMSSFASMANSSICMSPRPHRPSAPDCWPVATAAMAFAW